jgi:hypothetical protein
MSLMDFVASPPGCGHRVTDFWRWDAHEAQLRCPDEVDGDMWILSTRRGLNLSYTKPPWPCSPWESFPSRKNSHGNWTRDLMVSSQKLWPLDHEAGLIPLYKNKKFWTCLSLFIIYTAVKHKNIKDWGSLTLWTSWFAQFLEWNCTHHVSETEWFVAQTSQTQFNTCSLGP